MKGKVIQNMNKVSIIDKQYSLGHTLQTQHT